MMKKLLSCIALVGLMQVTQAAEPTDVSSVYLQNYSAPFAATGEALIPNTIGSGERFQKLDAPWITEGGVGTMGVDYTSWHVDFQKMPYYPSQDASRSGTMTLTPGWDGFSGTFSNMKVYQTVTLPAASYELIAQRAQDWTGAEGAYIVAAKGTTLPDIENLNTALGSSKFSTAVAPDWNVITTFVLTEETQISLGAVASYNAAKLCVTLAEFRLMQIMGINLRPLSTLITRYKAYTTTQYPVIGTYAESYWNSLQSEIGLAEDLVETGTDVTQEGLDAQILALTTAATVLDSMARLPKLVVTSKAFTNVQYPIGIVMGTYPQEKWDALQAAILVAQTFIERATVTTEEIETSTAALQLAIDNLNESMILPFKVSDDTDSHWYQIRDMRSPMNFMQMGEYERVSDDGLEYINVPIALTLTQEDNNTDDSQLFKMVKAPAPAKGYYIYNKLIEDVPLSLIDSLDVLQIDPDSAGIVWQFGTTKYAANYTIYSEGKINRQLNSFKDYTPPYVSFYYPGAGAHDNGNAWEFVELIEVGQTDFTQLKALVATASRMSNVDYPVGTAESQYPADSWNDFVAVRTLAVNMVGKEANDPQPTQEEVDEMTITLQIAIDELKASQNDAFFASDETSEYWYTLNDNRATKSFWKLGVMKTVIDTVVTNEIDTTYITTISNKLMMVKGKPAIISDSLLFKVVKAEDPLYGYFIYSKLDIVNPLTANVDANFIGINAELEPVTWLFDKSTVANHYLVSTEDSGSQANSYAGYVPPYIAFWDGGAADPGNNWRFTPYVAPTSVKTVKVSDLKVYVANRMIVSTNQEDRLTVYNISGQKIDVNRPLAQGIYIVRAEGKQTAVKVIVR